MQNTTSRTSRSQRHRENRDLIARHQASLERQAQLPSVYDAVRIDAPDLIVQHDRVSAHQTCAACVRTWGAEIDEYAPDGIVIASDDSGAVCPDPACAGAMGLHAHDHARYAELCEAEDEIERTDPRGAYYGDCD